MRKLKKLFYLLHRAVLPGALAALGACQQTDNLLPNTSPEDLVEFRFGREAFSADNETAGLSSRASIGEDGSGNFQEGDRVGLYVGENPARHYILTLRDGTWQPRLTRQELGEGLVTVNAYYPANDKAPAETMAYTHTLSDDQHAEGYGASDILWVNRTVNLSSPGSGSIELTLRHAMHRVMVHVSAAEGALPSDLQVCVSAPLQTTFDLFTGKATPSDDAPKQWIAAHSLSEGRYCAVVPSGKLSDIKEWVRLESSGKQAFYDAPAFVGGSSSLESGHQTTLSLTIKAASEPVPDTPDPQWAGRKQWVYGVTSPVYPDDDSSVKVYQPGTPEKFPDGEWFKIDGYSRQYIQWTPGCGWYDAKKINALEGGQDGNMCWAASSSCVLHWWLYHNKPYVDAYTAKYGNTFGADPEVPLPSEEFYGWADFSKGETDSPIFDFFRKICRNIAGNDYYAINWFIRGGVAPHVPRKEEYYDKNGFFDRVFAKDAEIATETRAPYKEEFNRIVKDVLTNDKALSFSVTHSPTQHIMTIWGAEFDQNGYVSAVYFVNNNDYDEFEVVGGTNDFQRHRCYRVQVEYTDEGVWISKGMMITALVPVDLARDTWKKAFPDVQIQE